MKKILISIVFITLFSANCYCQIDDDNKLDEEYQEASFDQIHKENNNENVYESNQLPKQKNVVKTKLGYRIGNLEILNKEFGTWIYDVANSKCKKLGDGWRLPTPEELQVIYENKSKLWNFRYQHYWGLYENTTEGYVQMDFTNGDFSFVGRDINPVHGVIAVRTVSERK